MVGEVEARAARRVTWLLLLAVALVGLSEVAFLPPWEGFDETAHWSYVQELVDRGRPPQYGVDKLSHDLDLYPGPMPYGGAPPFEKTGRLTYRTYRKSGSAPLAGGPTRYVEGRELNWQAQHPPLYYLLMVPVYRLSRGLGWVNHLLALRAASFGLSFAGFALGVLATSRSATRRLGPERSSAGGAMSIGVWVAPIMAAWPFFVPEFFPEFARIGNDSLCLLLVGAVWALLLEVLVGQGGWGVATVLGVVLGLGLLTKAFFLPIMASVAAMMLARWWTRGRGGRLFGETMWTVVPALAIGGWWYVVKGLETGSLTGSDEFIRLNHSGGLAAIIGGFSASELGHGLITIPETFIWAGTWSLAALPPILLLAPAMLLAVAAVNYLARLPRGNLIAWAPLVFAMPMAAGLVYHVFTWMAGASAVTPGWYFHILAAPLGFAVALGWSRPRLMTALTGLTAIYTVLAWTLQLSLFSGCASKFGDNRYYSFQGANCFVDGRTLSSIGHPYIGSSLLLSGLSAAFVACALAWRAHQLDR